MRVSIGNKEENDDVDEESNLAGDIEKEQVFRESSEEAKLQGSEEGGVHRPYQNELRPQLRYEYLVLFKEILAHCGIIYTDPAIVLLTCPLQNTTVQRRGTTQATLN
uniref:Potassium channel SKOR n=1 Tax=Solanum tuberosum TaxID=4113 RepID=M1D7F4_SOLTU